MHYKLLRITIKKYNQIILHCNSFLPFFQSQSEKSICQSIECYLIETMRVARELHDSRNGKKNYIHLANYVSVYVINAVPRWKLIFFFSK